MAARAEKNLRHPRSADAEARHKEDSDMSISHGKKTGNGAHHHRSGRTLGPLSDLERHLPPDWWRTLFNSLYLKTDGDVVENAENTVREVDLLVQAAGLRTTHAILDLCCGQGRHCLELAGRGYSRVTGVDRSRYLIRLARKRAAKARLPLTFREGDARKFRLPAASMDCVTLFGNSFGYFERAEDDLAVLKGARRVLKPGGALLLDLVEGEWMRQHFAPRTWEWIDGNHFVCRERALASDGARLITREVVTHAERGVIADQFYAERLYSRTEITDLLERAGFVDMVQIEAPATNSDRQQDLGMMAQRMFILSRLPKAVSPASSAPSTELEVTVLLGDPGLPDDVKRDGQFNEEDFATVEKMKEALEEDGGYRFRYWSDHSRLMEQLVSDPPRFVFNLCDEGFHNDAFKELHVPALLEMLGIPYSGAGPACLALCYNKSLVRNLAQSLDIPGAPRVLFRRRRFRGDLAFGLSRLAQTEFRRQQSGNHPRRGGAHEGTARRVLGETPGRVSGTFPARAGIPERRGIQRGRYRQPGF